MLPLLLLLLPEPSLLSVSATCALGPALKAELAAVAAVGFWLEASGWLWERVRPPSIAAADALILLSLNRALALLLSLPCFAPQALLKLAPLLRLLLLLPRRLLSLERLLSDLDGRRILAVASSCSPAAAPVAPRAALSAALPCPSSAALPGGFSSAKTWAPASGAAAPAAAPGVTVEAQLSLLVSEGRMLMLPGPAGGPEGPSPGPKPCCICCRAEMP